MDLSLVALTDGENISMGGVCDYESIPGKTYLSIHIQFGFSHTQACLAVSKHLLAAKASLLYPP